MITEIIRTETVLGKSVRVCGTPKDPLFIAKNVADWLGNRDVTSMCRVVDEDEKLLRTVSGVGGQQREVVMLTEFGMYEVLFLSRKKIAKAFKKEVKRILHELRTKGYAIAANITKSQLAQMVIDSEKENVALEATNKALAETNDKLMPKVAYYDEVMQIENLMPVTIIAKGLGMSAIALNAALHQKEIIFPVGKTWVLYSPYQDKGYAEHQIFTRHGEEVSRHLYWTEKGCEFVHNLFKQ